MQRHQAVCSPGGEPGLIFYNITDFPASSSANTSAAGDARARPVQQASHVPANAVHAVPIDTEGFVGEIIFLIRPSGPKSAASIDSRYAEYFVKRRRNWEIRVQGRFKFLPQGELHVGCVLRDFNYDQSVAAHSKIVQRAALSMVTSYELYYSWGDRCEAAKKPDAELSHLVTGMSGWDQIIVTAPGRTPPDMTSTELQDIGDTHGLNLERNKMGVKAFSEAVEETLKHLSLEDTYTMCFWGVSQVIDAPNWQLKIGTSVSLRRFFPDSPLHLVMYDIARGGGPPGSDQRHLESSKRYYLDLMFWSTLLECPMLPARYAFVDAPLGLSSAAGGGSFLRSPASPVSSCDGDSLAGRRPSLLQTWGEKLRWIPGFACSHNERGG